MKKVLIIFGIIAILFTLLFYTPVGTYAFSYFAKQVAGLAQDRYTGEVTIIDTHASGTIKYSVWMQSTANTQPGHVYTLYLYFDDVVQAQTATVNWVAGEIPGTIKKVTISGLNMSAVTQIDPEVRP